MKHPNPSRAGPWLWMLVAIAAAYWLGSLILFVWFGFNPGGSVQKDLLWVLTQSTFSIVTVILLAGLLFFWRSQRYRWQWQACLALTATSPVWFAVLVAIALALL